MACLVFSCIRRIFPRNATNDFAGKVRITTHISAQGNLSSSNWIQRCLRIYEHLLWYCCENIGHDDEEVKWYCYHCLENKTRFYIYIKKLGVTFSALFCEKSNPIRLSTKFALQYFVKSQTQYSCFLYETIIMNVEHKLYVVNRLAMPTEIKKNILTGISN